MKKRAALTAHAYHKHHRKCRSRGGKNDKRNISIVQQNQHVAYHILFRNMEPEEIAKLLNDVWINPDYELIARKKDAK